MKKEDGAPRRIAARRGFARSRAAWMRLGAWDCQGVRYLT
jgi:hypothetical protein